MLPPLTAYPGRGFPQKTEEELQAANQHEALYFQHLADIRGKNDYGLREGRFDPVTRIVTLETSSGTVERRKSGTTPNGIWTFNIPHLGEIGRSAAPTPDAGFACARM
jgi:hypothetical protein